MRATRTIVGVMVAVVGIGAAVAEAGKIYWTEQGKICRADAHPGATKEILFSGLGQPQKIALDLDGGKMYWVDYVYNSVHRANLDGTGEIETINLGVTVYHPIAIAVDTTAGKLYVSSTPVQQPSKIYRADLDGSNTEEVGIYINGETQWSMFPTLDITLDTGWGHIYWCRDDNGTGAGDQIRRRNIDGSGVVEILYEGSADGPSGVSIAFDEGRMYWSERSGPTEVARANLDGSEFVTLLHDVSDWAFDIELDTIKGKMYWVDSGTGTIYRADMTLGAVAETVLTGLTDSNGIALDLRDDNPIPAVSTWGVVIMTLLVLTLGTIVITNQQRRQQAFV